jgi:glycosyltransferase involved in cell wall biosynthesis
MKIGIDIRPLREVMIGIGRYISKMSEALTQSGDGNEYVFFYTNITNKPIQGLPANKNYHLSRHRWPDKMITNLWGYTNHPKAERFTGPLDVFHSPSFQVPPTKKAARVFTIFDLIAIAFPDMAIPSSVRHFRPRIKQYVSRADVIVAISKATAGDIVNILGIQPEKIRVVYPGTTPLVKAIPEKISETRVKYNLQKDYILFVSRLDPRKNLSRLFKAFEYSELFNDFDLVVAGPKGWHMEEMFQTWRDIKCRDQIKWLYFVSDEELTSLYSGAAFFVYPSLVEGFGLPILEAMSVGCPVLTSNVSSMPEAAGEAAVYVDPYDIASISDGMMQLAGNSYLREQMSTLGYERIKQFTWENVAHEMSKIYIYAREVVKARQSLKS